MKEFTLNIPLTHAVLVNGLKEYSRPNDKISYMLEKEDLLSLSKGKYVSKKAQLENFYLNYQIANILNGPSYISRYSALSFYGLLSESTSIIESMTQKRSRIVENRIGSFHFYSQPTQSVFSVGVETKKISDDVSFLIASPAKAICDIIWTTPALQLSSIDDLIYFLEEDIRLDMGLLKNAGVEEIEYMLAFGKKKKEIKLLSALIKSMR